MGKLLLMPGIPDPREQQQLIEWVYNMDIRELKELKRIYDEATKDDPHEVHGNGD